MPIGARVPMKPPMVPATQQAANQQLQAQSQMLSQQGLMGHQASLSQQALGASQAVLSQASLGGDDLVAPLRARLAAVQSQLAPLAKEQSRLQAAIAALTE